MVKKRNISEGKVEGGCFYHPHHRKRPAKNPPTRETRPEGGVAKVHEGTALPCKKNLQVKIKIFTEVFL